VPRELSDPDGLYPGVPYHYTAAGRGQAVVFTAGACPLDAAGEVTPAGDVEGQTRQALDNLTIALRAAGCGLADIVKTTVFVATSTREDLLAAWTEYESVLGSDGPPSTLLGVAVLGWPGQLVEIEAVAFRS
jgi:enamine deaminase RidA (YjgF/YER057c/UK114 family)